MMQSLSANALTVLRQMECEDDRVRITSGDLERSLYEEVNEALVRLGGKWKGGRTRAHQFPYDPRPLLAGVLATGEMPPKNPFAFFPTPAPLVDAVMKSPLFDEIQDGDYVLEPSAGFGALAEGMRTRLAHRQVQVDCVELQSINQQVLRAKGFNVVHDDFLTYHPEKRYRAIIMNPPYSVEKDRLAYITHIRHAWELLADGGFLIAFAPSAYTFRSDKKSYDFLSFVLTYGDWEELPPKSFHTSGTDSNITLMTLEKQDLSWRYRPYNGCPTWFCHDLLLIADNNRARQRIVTQLDQGELCADPKAPAFEQTRTAIRDFYQEVIDDARKNGHRHVDIRSEDWSFLERKFLVRWNDAWQGDESPSEDATQVASEREVPVVDVARNKETTPAESPKQEAATAGSPIAGEEREASASRVPFLPTGTALYSPFPSTELSCEQLAKEASILPRDAYPTMPWYMEMLVGTTWRNIHTGEGHIVHHLGVNRFGRPVLCAALPTASEEPYGQALEIVGFWSGDRYLVEEWVRVDLQSEETQLRWFGVELAWLSSQIAFCENKVAEYRWDATNSALYERVKKGHQSQLQAAMVHMREFADQHRLCIPIEVLNSGLHGSDHAPVQMAMF